MTYTLWTKTLPICAAALIGGTLFASLGPGLSKEAGLVPLMKREVFAPADVPAPLVSDPVSDVSADTSETDASSDAGVLEAHDCPPSSLDVGAPMQSGIVLQAAAPPVALSIAIVEPEAPIQEVLGQPEAALKPKPEVQLAAATRASGVVTWSYITPSPADVRALVHAGYLRLRVHLSDGQRLSFLPGPRDDVFWSEGRLMPDPGGSGATRLSGSKALISAAQIRARVVAARLGATYADVSLLVAPAETQRLQSVIAAARARIGSPQEMPVTAYGCWQPDGFALAALTVNGTRHVVAADACPTL
jgi:hypothetical protein